MSEKTMEGTNQITSRYAYCPYCEMWYDAVSYPKHGCPKEGEVPVTTVIDYTDKLDRIIKLLESIEYQLRTK